MAIVIRLVVRDGLSIIGCRFQSGTMTDGAMRPAVPRASRVLTKPNDSLPS